MRSKFGFKIGGLYNYYIDNSGEVVNYGYRRELIGVSYSESHYKAKISRDFFSEEQIMDMLGIDAEDNVTEDKRSYFSLCCTYHDDKGCSWTGWRYGSGATGGLRISPENICRLVDFLNDNNYTSRKLYDQIEMYSAIYKEEWEE